MTKPAHRTRYFAGPEVWTLAQEAYLAGEPAATIAKRLNLTVNGIRKRAARKGWTRTAHAAAMKRRKAPDVALAELVAGIVPLMRQDRLEEAADLARSAERMARVVGAMPEPGELTAAEKTALWAMQDAWRHRERKRMDAEYLAMAERLAAQIMRDQPDLRGPEGGELAAWHWRARHLGPEVALRDLAMAIEGGWSSHFWDAEGTLKPLRIPARPTERGLRQHLWLAEGGSRERADTEIMPWPPAGVAEPS